MASETMIKSAMNKVCSNIEQKGVAQLLQIEEMQLKSSRRCSLSQSPHAQEANTAEHFRIPWLVSVIGTLVRHWYYEYSNHAIRAYGMIQLT